MKIDKNGITHYFHRSVVYAIVGAALYTILGQKMIEPKKDSFGMIYKEHERNASSIIPFVW